MTPAAQSSHHHTHHDYSTFNNSRGISASSSQSPQLSTIAAQTYPQESSSRDHARQHEDEVVRVSYDDASTLESGSTGTHEQYSEGKSSIRDFLTVLALSLHAVFEGLAVGLEQESDDVWTFFVGNFLKTDFNFSLVTHKRQIIAPVIYAEHGTVEVTDGKEYLS